MIRAQSATVLSSPCTGALQYEGRAAYNGSLRNKGKRREKRKIYVHEYEGGGVRVVCTNV